MIPPELSVTVPEMLPVPTCATAMSVRHEAGEMKATPNRNLLTCL